MNNFIYGKSSEQKLSTCHPYIQHIFRKTLALGLVDITVTHGHRGSVVQNQLFTQKLSKTPWPDSKHNRKPSEGIDAYPYINGSVSFDVRHCIYLAGIIMAVDKMDSGRLAWGGNWDMDTEIMTDQDFQDLGHFELDRRG